MDTSDRHNSTATEVLEAYFFAMETARNEKLDLQFIREQLRNGTDPNAITRSGLNFLSHWFVHHGKKDVVFIGMYGGTEVLDMFIEHGADLNRENAEGQMNLMSIVCQHGNGEIIRYFVKRGGDLMKPSANGNCGMWHVVRVAPSHDHFRNYARSDPRLTERENLLKIKNWIETLQQERKNQTVDADFYGNLKYERERLLHDINFDLERKEKETN